jgi:hypothetical protein
MKRLPRILRSGALYFGIVPRNVRATEGHSLRDVSCKSRVACSLVAVIAAAYAAVCAAATGPGEYQVKAVFLFNFTQFVEWPAAAFADEKAPFVICVVGRDPFGKNLDEAVRGERVGSRELVVQRHESVDQLGHCQILFVADPAAERPAELAAALEGRSVLTVGDAQGRAGRDVVIGFVSDRNRIRLRINLKAAQEAGLVISSKLLRPAEIVGGSRG